MRLKERKRVMLSAGRLFLLLLVALTAVVGFGGSGRTEPAFDLSGEWEMTLPIGFKYRSPILRLDETYCRIPNIAGASGVYERRGSSTPGRRVYDFARLLSPDLASGVAPRQDTAKSGKRGADGRRGGVSPRPAAGRCRCGLGRPEQGCGCYRRHSERSRRDS